ncbi:hypothetical protein E2I00_010726, partial [Balaenoptera physalus]
MAVPDVGARTEVQRHLQGTGGVAGVVLLPAGHKKSFFQATAEHLLPMGATLPVLEAQDATCMLVDPATGRQLWVDEAVRAGLFGPELHRQLLAAEQVVTGYHDPFSGTRIPLFQAMKRELAPAARGGHPARRLPGQRLGSISHRRLASRTPACRRASATGSCWPTGRPVSLWELLFSEAVPVEQRDHLCWVRIPVTPGELLRAEIINQGVYEQLERGRTMAQDVGSLASVQRYLRRTGCTAGLLLPSSQEPLSIHEAPHRHRLHRPLHRGADLSLFQAMKKDLIVREHGICLLETQIATGGVIDPVHSRCLPVDDPSDDTKGFFDPNLQLLECCVRDPNTGLYVLQVVKKGETYMYVDEATRQALQSKTTRMHVGRFADQRVSFWDLLSSPYFTEKRKRGLVQDGCIAGVATPSTQEVMSIYEASRKGLIPAGFAAQLLEAQVATGFMLDPHGHQRLSVDEAMAAGLVGKELQERLLNAEKAAKGYADPTTGHTISFQAMKKKLLKRDLALRLLEVQVATGASWTRCTTTGFRWTRPTDAAVWTRTRTHSLRSRRTALVLLEAQAATGFVINPVENRKLTVQEAFAAGMFSSETYQKLLSAKRSVTGYTDPYTGEQISLFQAVKKDLVVREHGIRLLEAQIATGSVIDPMHSRRLPVDNFTYVQLLQRATPDPETGLFVSSLSG